MGKFDKLILKLVLGNSDNSFNFNDLVKILLSLGFQMRRSGTSHHIFSMKGIPEIINIQPKGSEAKPYQIKQMRELILKYKLWQDGKEDK